MARPIDDVMDEGDASNDDEDQNERNSMSRTSSEMKEKKRVTMRRFDIKQLKAEIWKILETRLPSYYRTQAPQNTQDFRIHL